MARQMSRGGWMEKLEKYKLRHTYNWILHKQKSNTEWWKTNFGFMAPMLS